MISPMSILGFLMADSGSGSLSAATASRNISDQAGALRHAIAKAVAQMSPTHRPTLKKEGLLTRDSRVKERKKYGQKGARKRFQYSKR